MKYFPEGSAFLMGPMSGDHWFVFVADYVDRTTSECVDRTLDIMMFGIDEEVAKLFNKDPVRFPKDSDVTKVSGIDTLLPGSSIQEFCFEPCGYSMNGLLYDAYWTIHITPESHCSYASFETNIRMRDYSSLIKAVLAIFRPQRFTMTLFADEYGLKQLNRLPFDHLLTVPLVETAAQAVMGPCILLADGNTVYPTVPTSTKETANTNSNSDPTTNASSTNDSGGVSPTPEPDANSSSSLKKGLSSSASSNNLLVVGRRGALSYVSSHKSSSEFMGYSCFMSNFRLVHTAQGQSKDVSAVPEAAKEMLSMPRAKYIVSERLEQLKQQRVRTESF